MARLVVFAVLAGEFDYPGSIAASRLGSLYVSDQTGRIQRFGLPPSGDTVAPVISGASVSPRTVRVPRKPPSLSRASKRRYTLRPTVRYRLSEAASVCMTVGAGSARASGHAEPPLALDFPARGRIGANRYRSSDIALVMRFLPKGRYSVVITATDLAGNAAAPASANFRVVRR
jgi:hypothetical protein